MKNYFSDFHIDLLIALIIILAALDVVYKAPHLGVEFVGGTQIPVQLAHPVNPDTMSTLISILQQRLSTFGLKQVTVEGIGNQEIYVIIPSVSKSEVDTILSLIESQGVFQGIVNGKEALNGSGIVPASIGAIQPQVVDGNVSWQVSFFITQQAAEKFARVVFGQANKPLYMFLDRPTGAVLLLNNSLFSYAQLHGINATTLMNDIYSVTQLGNETIPVKFYSPSSINQTLSFLNSSRSKYNTLIVANNAPKSILSYANSLNYTIRLETPQNMTPVFSTIASPSQISTIISSWPAIGLLSAPILSPSVTNGTISQSYEISGMAPTDLTLPAKLAYAENQTQLITSILKGGALPVPVVASTASTIPPTLGKHFEQVSELALLIAVVAVSLAISIRYKRRFLILPIIFTTLASISFLLIMSPTVGAPESASSIVES